MQYLQACLCHERLWFCIKISDNREVFGIRITFWGNGLKNLAVIHAEFPSFKKICFGCMSGLFSLHVFKASFLETHCNSSSFFLFSFACFWNSDYHIWMPPISRTMLLTPLSLSWNEHWNTMENYSSYFTIKMFHRVNLPLFTLFHTLNFSFQCWYS